jgi:hypothetical protein
MTAETENLFDPSNFPALLEFLPAYLHEDFGEEYGSVAQAITALIADASGDQIYNLRQEWNALRELFAGQPLQHLQQALRELGAAWHPQSEQEVRSVDEILRQAEA